MESPKTSTSPSIASPPSPSKLTSGNPDSELIGLSTELADLNIATTQDKDTSPESGCQDSESGNNDTLHNKDGAETSLMSQTLAGGDGNGAGEEIKGQEEAGVTALHQGKVKEKETTCSGSDPVPFADEPKIDMDSMLKKCKAIALNKAFHATLISDEVMCPFLVLCLDSSSQDTVFRALDVFHLLAMNPDNRQGLSKVSYFFDGLKAAASNKSLPKELRDFAILIYGTVKKMNKPLKAKRGNCNQSENQIQPKSCKQEKAADHQHHSNRNHSVSKGKSTYLYIPQCIFKEKRLKMTEALLTLHGVISITYDMNKSHCVIRGKSTVPSDIFGKAIANLGFECHHVTKNEAGDEVLSLMNSDPKLENSKSLYDQENAQVPEYLSDTDSEKDMSTGDMTQSVALTGSEGKGKKSGWISSAANFLQKSFYW